MIKKPESAPACKPIMKTPLPRLSRQKPRRTAAGSKSANRQSVSGRHGSGDQHAKCHRCNYRDEKGSKSKALAKFGQIPVVQILPRASNHRNSGGGARAEKTFAGWDRERGVGWKCGGNVSLPGHATAAITTSFPLFTSSPTGCEEGGVPLCARSFPFHPHDLADKNRHVF